MTRVVINVARRLDGLLPIGKFATMDEMRKRALQSEQFNLWLLGSFAGLALALAALGIYSVISYSVSRQAQEIGIRMALGASSRRVQFGVVAQTLWLALIGIGIGAASSFVVTRGIASLLYETAPSDPTVFGSMILILCGVALIAGQIPARRAARIDPMSVLRGL